MKMKENSYIYEDDSQKMNWFKRNWKKAKGFTLRNAIIRYIDGRKWVCCPLCGKKAFTIESNTVIHNLNYQCKDSRCKLIFVVNTH